MIWAKPFLVWNLPEVVWRHGMLYTQQSKKNKSNLNRLAWQVDVLTMIWGLRPKNLQKRLRTTSRVPSLPTPCTVSISQSSQRALRRQRLHHWPLRISSSSGMPEGHLEVLLWRLGWLLVGHTRQIAIVKQCLNFRYFPHCFWLSKFKYIRIYTYVHFELFRDERRDTLHVGPQSKPFLSPILSLKIK